MCLTVNDYRDRAVCNWCLNPLEFCVCGAGRTAKFMKMKVDTADELLARILDAAANIKKREYQLRRITRDFHTRVVKCVEVGGGICERLL